MRLGYADPPYPGLARRYYKGHADYAGEVDHWSLIVRLEREFPDGWALSTSAAALPSVIRLCPEGVRVAAWFRGERPTISRDPLSAWEPVVFRGGRRYKSRLEDRRLDALVYFARPRLTDPHRIVGAKPAEFCWWLFDLLGALPGDELVDLFPGSGGVARAWRFLQSRGTSLATPEPELALADPRDASRLARAGDDASNGAGAGRLVPSGTVGGVS